MNYVPLIVVPTTILILLLVGWMLRRNAAAGWQPLATAFPMTAPPTGQQIRLTWASIGGSALVGHKSVVVANVSPAGLTLQMPLLAWLCYPAMQIPWSACGPFTVEKRLILRTRYTTLVRLPDGNSVAVRIEDAAFARAAQPWITVGDAR